MPLHFRAKVTLFHSGCFPTPRPKNSQKSSPKLLELPRFQKDCWAVASYMCDQMSILQTKGYEHFFLSLFSICYHSSCPISPSSLYVTIPLVPYLPLFPHFIIPANHCGRRTKSLFKDGKLWCPCVFSTNWTKFHFAMIQTNTGNFCGSFL
jgi:hypothetical protein